MAQKADLSSVESIMIGAAPLDNDTAVAVQKRIPQADIGQGYGMTETCTAVTLFPPALKESDRNRFPKGSAGVLMPQVKLKVVDASGKTLGFGERGELWFQSPSNAKGYLNNKKATEDTFDSEGYVHTGQSL